MTDEAFLDLFDAERISPDQQRSRNKKQDVPVYFAGGYMDDLDELKERNEAEPIGKQSGGRRSRRQTRRGKSKSKNRSYRRRR
jgi:hypothetical protein